jgi:hypothetical protein
MIASCGVPESAYARRCPEMDESATVIRLSLREGWLCADRRMFKTDPQQTHRIERD